MFGGNRVVTRAEIELDRVIRKRQGMALKQARPSAAARTMSADASFPIACMNSATRIAASGSGLASIGASAATAAAGPSSAAMPSARWMRART